MNSSTRAGQPGADRPSDRGQAARARGLRELEIAELLDERDRTPSTRRSWRCNEEQLRRAILILWRTNLLRQTKLKVVDEVVERPLLLRPHVLP